jgi:hypothetical protein
MPIMNNLGVGPGFFPAYVLPPRFFFRVYEDGEVPGYCRAMKDY